MDERTELTALHGKVIDALNYAGIYHLDEWLVETEGEEFQLDCYLPNYHACVEADGPSHGMRGKKDKRRDALLLSVGIPTLRLRWDFIKQLNVEALARHISLWVGDQQESKSQRRSLIQSPGGITRAPRMECTCPDDCLRHEDIGGL